MNNNTVEIYEHENRTQFSISVELNHITGFTQMTDDAKHKFALECIRTDLSTISEFISGLGFDLAMDNADGKDVGNIIEILAKLSKGLSNAWECIDMQFEREAKERASVDAPLDLSDSSIEALSLKLSDIMQNPALPKQIYNCLADEIGYNADFDSSKPEAIKSALKNMEGKDE